MSITLAVYEQVAGRARKVASAMGKSLDPPVRDYLRQLAGAEQWLAKLKAFEASAVASPGCLKSCRFDRGEADARA